MPHLLDLTLEQLQTRFAERGLPVFRAGQVWRAVFQHRAGGFHDVTELPKSLRAELAEEWSVFSSEVVRHRRSRDGTEKLLLRLADGEQTECVLLRDDKHHRTVCLSTQVGCAMGCAFCASGLDGLVRNLTGGEIVEQALQLQRLLPPDERLSHIVIMGMGEPLANLDAVLAALENVAAEDALGISARRVTISTVGLPKGIRRLAECGSQYHLAVSLHAADDELRNRLVPTNRNVGLRAILAAADDYFARTGRRVTFECVLLADVNDGAAHAKRLAALLKGRPALLNVIPYNPVPGLPYRTPASAATSRFAETLERAGITVKVRYRKGNRIDAACGQLRRRSGDAETESA